MTIFNDYHLLFQFIYFYELTDAFVLFTNEDFRTPVRIFGAELSIRDLVGIAPQPSSLNRIRSDLHAYAVRTFGSPISETNLQAVSAKNVHAFNGV